MTYTSHLLGLQKPNERASLIRGWTEVLWNSASITEIFSTSICNPKAKLPWPFDFGWVNWLMRLSYLCSTLHERKKQVKKELLTDHQRPIYRSFSTSSRPLLRHRP